ncbi:ferrochelatase [Roseateles amylovorans]|uniref:Ferrochelatase n=1 Tax=Roseateles amylovorans TaxID=2978473 RepID=A0ABY6AVQ1_9BURK|nr:ferrochelatase [Roseateles amylovorans]UXH77018.1 ferrochelatase [Roseateles amylovorans]
MSFRPEPTYNHGSAPTTGLLLCNLGTPDAPTPAATRRYLAQFLADPRVIEIPKLAWLPILHGIILRTRPAKSAKKYASIWMKEGSPLAVWTERQAKMLQGYLGERGHRLIVRHAMRYGNPSIASQLDALREAGATRLLVLPAYPQYCAATTASVIDDVSHWMQSHRNLPELRIINRYHDDAGYIAALAESVRAHWQREGRSDMLVMSFHGMPARTLAMGDPYHCECLKTGRLLAEALGLSPAQYKVTFQSRFGKARWLEPYTEPTLRKLASEGLKSVDLICPGFAADCIETLEEIDMEAREAFLHSGGQQFSYIPCLNDSPAHVRALASLAERHLQGWPTQTPPQPAELARQREAALITGASR